MQKSARLIRVLLVGTALALAPVAAPAQDPNPENNAYFGSVHVHTSWSFDGLTNGSLATPTDAFDWAQGRTITGSGGPEITRKTPLDFYMVSDHAEYMGVFNQMSNPESPLSKTEIAKGVTSPDANTRIQTFAAVLRDMNDGDSNPELTDPALARSVWSEIVKAAEEACKPGNFAGFEWTSAPNSRNLHRVVVFRDTAHLPELVISALDTDDPEKLWAWIDGQRGNRSTRLAIPLNGNASGGLMYELTKFDGTPIDAAHDAAAAKNEPLIEIARIKGTSETHPDLSPNDKFAGFEQWDCTLSAFPEHPTHRAGSFARQALLGGLSQQAADNGNPFKFGFIGDSDTHNAAGTNEEFNYTGKFGLENDPKSGNLDRVQVVKVWLDGDGTQQEKVFDVAWSGERGIGPDGKLPPVGNTVDVATATYTNDIGSAGFATSWTDPEFSPDQPAFHYTRVIGIPTPRWNTYDAVRAGLPPLTNVPTTIQERAWSWPIWYTP